MPASLTDMKFLTPDFRVQRSLYAQITFKFLAAGTMRDNKCINTEIGNTGWVLWSELCWNSSTQYLRTWPCSEMWFLQSSSRHCTQVEAVHFLTIPWWLLSSFRIRRKFINELVWDIKVTVGNLLRSISSGIYHLVEISRKITKDISTEGVVRLQQ